MTMTLLEQRAREKAREITDNWCSEWRAMDREMLEQEIMKVLLASRREGLEDAAGAICQSCANNDPLLADGIHAVLCPDCHQVLRADQEVCKAQAINTLKRLISEV